MQPLPLPFVISGEPDSDDIQGNFDALKKEFPLSRRHMKIETARVVGAAGQPAFVGAWVNFNTATFRGARFWKDPMGIVHIEGLVKTGAVPGVIFTLPVGERPGNALSFATVTNTGFGSLDVLANGDVKAQAGGNGSFSINVSFKQEG